MIVVDSENGYQIDKFISIYRLYHRGGHLSSLSPPSLIELVALVL